MARRGRFGRSETGASNLTTLIYSLYRQQQEEEERLLLQAYYSQIEYKGSVPSLDTVLSFYNNLVGLGATEQEMFQKKNDITNYDIKRSYNNLIKEFNQSDGSNYNEVIDFISDRGMTSTDQDDLSEFAEAIDSTTTAYLRYQGESLGRGEITARDYQRITLTALQALEPGSDAYKTAIYDAYQYEWNAEAEKWRNRVIAGTASQGQYQSWAKSFANRVKAAGISTDSSLYTGIIASSASVGGGGGNPTLNKRLGKNIGLLAKAYTIAASATGVGEPKDLVEIEDDPRKVSDFIQKNPEIWVLYDEYLARNPDAANLLVDAGIKLSSADGFRDWREAAMDRVQSDYAISGDKDNYDDWNRVNRSTGRGSVLDDFAAASIKRNELLANAANPFAETYVRDQWRTYINGGNSKLFGLIPNGDPVSFAREIARAGQFYVSLYQNELNKANGKDLDKETVTISGFFDDKTGDQNIDNDWALDAPTRDDATELQSGVGVWDPKSRTVIAPTDAAFGEGVYNQIKFDTAPDGSLVPFRVAYSGEPLYAAGDDQRAVGHVYDIDGRTVAIDLTGNILDINLTKSVNNNWTIPQGTDMGAAKKGTASVIDTSVISTPALLDRYRVRVEGDAANGIKGILDTGQFTEQQKNEIRNDLARVQRDADLRKAAQLQTLPNLTPQQRREIYRLRGVSEATLLKWDRAVGPNVDKYEEVKPGVWQLKPEFADENKAPNPFVPRGFAPEPTLPSVVDIRTDKEKEDEFAQGVQGFIGGIGDFIAGGVKGLAGVGAPQSRPIGLDLFGAKENQPQGGGDVFFRNMPGQSMNNRDIVSARIRNNEKPIAPSSPTTKVFTPKQISASMVDFRAGEREPLNIKKDPRFATEEIEQSLVDFRAGERTMR
jgi:hypothetical protein